MFPLKAVIFLRKKIGWDWGEGGYNPEFRETDTPVSTKGNN